MDLLIQDVRYGLRRLLSSPLFTVMAILIVGGGIAANTAVFSVVDAFLLRPLPFDSPDRVVHVYQDSDEGQPESSSFPAYQAIASRADVFSGAAAIFYTTINAETDFGVRQSLVEFTTSSYFPVLGLHTLRGRWLAKDEDVTGAPPVAVVSYHAWRNRFGSDPDLVGQSVRLGGTPVTIVGIGPSSYNGSVNGLAVDFWLSLSALGPVAGSFAATTLERPQDHWFLIRARLRDGVTLLQARAAMNGLSAELGTRFAGQDQQRGIAVLPASDVRIHPSFDRALVPAAALLMGVVGLVLALVCSNLAILLLLRGAAQHRDVSIRIAMGAGRGRIVRQFLTESLVLSLAGGLVGCVTAGWLVGLVSAVNVPVAGGLADLALDYRVLAFATSLSILTGVAFGLAPALRAMRTEGAVVLGGVGTARRHVAMKHAMVGFQVALSLVLLTGTGLVIRSLVQMEGVDVGFAREHVAMIATSATQAGYEPPRNRRVYADLEDRIAALPGVESVVRTDQPPLARRPTRTLVIPEYVSPTGANTAEVPGAAVSANYFEALGIRIVRGATFRLQDDQAAPAVAVVSEAMARRYWGTVDVVGRRYRHDSLPDSWVDIIGVAADVKVSSLTEDPQPFYYRPWAQVGSPAVSFMVRARGNPRDLASTLGRVVREIDPRLPILQVSTLDEYLDQQLLLPRIGTGVLAGFSLVALALAALGLYAVVAFAVGERAREVGIRIALGARAPHVMWTIVRGVMAAVGVGLAAGLMLAIGAAQGLGAVLFHVSPKDPATLVASAGLLAMVAGVAACVPARRATRADPLAVLRCQ
jgi:predicted permease